jgi:hypothetical protein
MGQIYLAYRRDDAAAISGRIADRLRARFGAEAVLKDVNEAQTAGGVAAALRQCSALVVVIGPRWLSGALAQPNSQNYAEIVTALNRGIPIIPTLVHGATLPDFRLLPVALAPFVTRGSTTLGPEATFDRDMQALFEVLRRAAPGQGYRAPERRGSARQPALPGALGAQVHLARLAGRALLVALVLATVIGAVGGGSLLLARRLPSSTLYSFTIPSGVQLLDIANPPGSGDLWAVGGARETGDSCVLLHEAGGVWSTVHCPLHVELDSVSFVNDGDGWAVGTGAQGHGCGLLHFHDGSWTTVACPKGINFGYNPPAVRMNSHDDGWIVGGSSKFEGSTVLHYLNGTWKIYPTDTTDQLSLFTNLAVSKQSGFWGWSSSDFFNAVSGSWVDVLSDLGLALDATFTCNSLDFTPDGVGWAVGSVQLTIGATPRAHILEYQHGVWSAYPEQPSVGPLTLVRAGLFGEVWVAGGASQSDNVSTGGGLIMRYDGRKWKSVGDPIDGQIHGIADVPNGDAWAVGDDGRGAALLWYHGGYWRIFRATANSGAGT